MMKERKEKLAEALLLPINPALIVLLGIFTVVWGFWIANPFWTVFTQAPLYDYMAALAPEWVWGGIAITAGVVICIGAVKRSYRALTTGAGVAFIHWLLISLMYFAGDPLNTGGITALLLAVYAAMVYLNIRINFKPGRRPYRPRMTRR